MSDFIKVHRNDSRKKTVGVKNVEPISNIKIIRDEESYSDTSSSEDLSSVSDSSYSEPSPKKKTKKVLRKKEKYYPEQQHNFSAFSNPKKVNYEQQMDDGNSEYSSVESSQNDDTSSVDEGDTEKNSFEERQKMKQDLLIKIQSLEKKGFEFSKKFTMNSSYEEMEFEYSKVKKFIETQGAIKFSRRCLMACVTGLEFLNKKFDPFSVKLDGWSENVMESIDDYDNIFEKLHEKYSRKAEVAPEIELILTLGGSAFMFHLTNSLLKSPMMTGGMGGMLAQNNPNFLANMMGAMSQGMKEATKPPNFKGQVPMQSNFPKPMDTRNPIRQEMRGPSLDPNLFNGTPLANNYPTPPGPANFSMKAQQQAYHDPNPIDEDDRFSVASSDSSLSSVSVGSKTILTRAKGKKGGLELNII